MNLKQIKIAAFAAAGVLVGVSGYTFHYAKGTSYLSKDPKSCVNCHVMRDQYESWQHSSHHAVAGCVECHIPVEFPQKWIAKMENGFHHSKAFTFQNFHEPIMITEKNSRILQNNCVRCHAALTQNVHLGQNAQKASDLKCVTCHAAAGHAARD